MARVTNLSALTIPGFSFGFAVAVLFGLRRDLATDAIRVCRRLKPQYEGLEHIPGSGPVVVVPNHYGHEKLHVFWSMFAITNAVFKRRDPRLSMSERIPTWISQDQWPRREGDKVSSDWFSRWLFRRVLRVYDIIPHDPLPERRSARAAALHTLTQRATGRGTGQDGRPAPIVIFPEGRTSLDRTLVVPPAGAGSMLSLLSRAGVPLLPAAIHEPGGDYTMRFGPTFQLEREVAGADKSSRDEQWAAEVMRRIAVMLPAEMRGPYDSDAPSETGDAA